mmetsp:Transcript_6008/g.14845  ORF Transcript_6008/g.14845 Transcript_6008/m.14845 type:complete len:98 (+) Transcript_6008:3-296(+)
MAELVDLDTGDRVRMESDGGKVFLFRNDTRTPVAIKKMNVCDSGDGEHWTAGFCFTDDGWDQATATQTAREGLRAFEDLCRENGIPVVAKDVGCPTD